MGSDPGKQVNQQRQDIYNQTSGAYNAFAGAPTGNEQWMREIAQGMQNRSNVAADTSMADYGNIMKGYQDWTGGANAFANKLMGTPMPSFSYQKVSPTSVSYTEDPRLTQAGQGYGEFAQTGGYSPTDIQELRARGTSPITAAYGNTMRELDRARALGGPGGAVNYIAARSAAQRQLPQQMADAMTGVNAKLAEDIRSGRLAGMAGLTGIGTEVGGEQLKAALANQDVNMRAALANQDADLRTQQLTEQGYDARTAQMIAAQELGLKGVAGEASLYGTTPAMAATFGNQALQGYGNVINMDQLRNQYLLGLTGAELGASEQPAQQNAPWWQQALGGAASVIGLFSDENMKEDISPANEHDVAKNLKSLPIMNWKYKGDSTTHIGPMAQEFSKRFGVGDGHTIHPIDVMGVLLASRKAELKRGRHA